MKEGLQKGEREKARKIARKLLAKGEKIENIIELTELTKEEIETLKESTNANF